MKLNPPLATGRNQSTLAGGVCVPNLRVSIRNLSCTARASESAPAKPIMEPIGTHSTSILRDNPFSGISPYDPFSQVEDTLGDLWMENMISETDAATGGLPSEGEDDQPMYACSVKYGRDRDFLIKYGWVRIIDQKTSKAVYRHSEGMWTEQPSVKAARRAMRDFFDARRGEQRSSGSLAQKRRHNGRGKLTSSNEEEESKETLCFSSHGALPLLPTSLPALEVSAIKCEEDTKLISLPAAAVLASAPQTRSLQSYATDLAVIGSKRSKTTHQPLQSVAPAFSLPLLPLLQLPCMADEADGDDLEPWDDLDKCLRRKARNRQAAAKSRQRQQDHRRGLEDHNERLRQENSLLRRLVSESRVGEALGIRTALDPIDSLLAFGLETVVEDIA